PSELNPSEVIPSHVLSSSSSPSPKRHETKHQRTISDFFNILVSEYESSSYWDLSFTSFILVFLGSPSRKSANDFRRQFFSEDNSSCLSAMYTRSIDSFDSRLVKRLLYPIETDLTIVELFLKALLSGSVKEERNPLM